MDSAEALKEKLNCCVMETANGKCIDVCRLSDVQDEYPEYTLQQLIEIIVPPKNNDHF